MHLMYTIDEAGNRTYTLKKKTGEGKITKSAHPARFSPDDKFSRHRVTIKRRFGPSLSWLLRNLSDHILAAAPNGGYLALYRDRSRLAALSHAQPSHLLRPNIQVYTPAGRLIETLPYDPTRKIIALGWTPAEQLAVVLDDGIVRIYTLFAAAPQFTAANGTGTGGPLGGPGASTSAAAATSSS
ncbi:hypothetical protein A4X06_0g7094, partial [Tilletia controversa]